VKNLSKIRVYQLAKELNVDNKVLINKLSDLGISTNSHMSTLEEEEAKLVMELIQRRSKGKGKSKETASCQGENGSRLHKN
jgi:translation initiation factor IF-2